jgi:ATP-binding cassette, subfamily C, bacterial LapB
MRGRFIERGGRELDMVLASELFAQILALQMKARPASSGTLAARSRAYETLREFFISAALLALVDVPFALLMIGVVFMIGGPIGWILVAAVLLVLVVEAVIQAPLKKSVSESSESGIERMAFMGEAINALESVKAVNAEGALQHRFEQMVATSSRKNGRSHWYSLLGSSTTKALINLTSVGVVVMAAFQIQEHTMTMGGMIACVMLASRCMTPLAMVAGLMTRFQQTLDSLKSLNSIMALPRETGAGQKFIQRRPVHLNYRLDKVSVSYPGQLVPALKEVSLDIKEGERIAVLGRMGSGKSTLLRVLAKLYEPTAGQILLDGIDLIQYHPAVVRTEVGYLPQDGSILHGTIRENIALGMDRVSDEQIMEAVRMAGLEDFVAANPQGLHAPVGERGCLLSGGQRHAVILARTLLRRPKLLILDEPASNMDMQAEQQFLNSLNTYLQADPRRSLIVASHKTSTLALVKRIVVLHEGRVYRDGGAEAVMKDLARNSQRPATAKAAAPAPDPTKGESSPASLAS